MLTYSNGTGTSAPDTTPRPRPGVLDTLPKRYLADPFVVALAQECDRTRAAGDAERERLHEAQDDHFDVMSKAIGLEAERNWLAAELAAVKASRWTPTEIAAVLCAFAFVLMAFGLFAVPAVAHLVGGA